MNKSTLSLIKCIEAGNRIGLNSEIKKYKDTNGSIKFGELVAIPSSDRIQGLILGQGEEDVAILLVTTIQLAMESLNLTKPLSAGQVVELAGIIIEASSEDNLAVEDVVLFLQKLVRGETGKNYSKMDVPMFMEMFESYRQKRDSEVRRIRDEINAQYKSAGNHTQKVSIERDNNIDPTTFFEMLKDYNAERHDAEQ